jgi:hypothetical protein
VAEYTGGGVPPKTQKQKDVLAMKSSDASLQARALEARNRAADLSGASSVSSPAPPHSDRARVR